MRGTRIFGMVLAVACLLAACTSPPRPDATSTGQPTLPPTSTEDVRSAEVTSRPPMTATRAAAVVSPSPTASPTRETPPSPTPSATPTPTASPTPTPTEVPPDARYDPAVLELVAQFNAWRMSEQRWPLRLNDTLVEMAQDQARYVASLPTIPYGVTIHLDAEGLEEKGRALRYGWPHYRTEQQVAVGEVAAVARTAQDAINWWKGSEVHRNISLSDAFREVGAAVVPVAGGGNLYIIVVGSRPGVLPALMDVETRQVYLTSERYRWAATGDWMQAVTRVQLVSSEAGPSALEGWLPWTLAITPPDGTVPPIFVALSDGLRELIVRVVEGRGGLWFPSVAAAPTAPVPAGTAPSDTATPVPGVPSTPTRTPTPLPTPTPDARRDVLLLYDNTSLALLNVSGGRLDISRLVLRRGGQTFPVTRWQTEWLGAPLNAFPDRHCLHVWGFGYGDPGRPEDCISRSSVIYISPAERLWLEGEF